MRFKNMDRDWKGTHDDRSAKGWVVFAVEGEIDSGGDSQVVVLTDDYQAALASGMSGQEVHDLIERMKSEDVDGWADVDSFNSNTIEKV